MAAKRREPAYHAKHAARAMQVLHDLHSAGTSLSPADFKRCDDYSKDVFGDRKYMPWLLVYTAVSGSFKEGWIPDNFYGEKVVPAIQGPYGRVSLLKSVSAALFDSPAFPDLGSRINGSLFDRAYRRLSFEQARKQFFEHGDHIMFKGDGSGQGKAVRTLAKRSFDRETIEHLGNGVFQRRVAQHGFFDLFSDRAVASLRITTVVKETGEITPRASYLCIATGSDTHVQARSRLRVPVDVATGALGETGHLTNWVPCEAHPTSGERFAGKTIPAFEQCLQTAVSHHQRIPFVGAIGWDIAVNRDERVRILEWNGFHNGIGYSEATQGPCFADLGWERLA